MGSQLRWLERAPDKREVGGSSPLEPTRLTEVSRKQIIENGIKYIRVKRTDKRTIFEILRRENRFFRKGKKITIKPNGGNVTGKDKEVFSKQTINPNICKKKLKQFREPRPEAEDGDIGSGRKKLKLRRA